MQSESLAAGRLALPQIIPSTGITVCDPFVSLLIEDFENKLFRLYHFKGLL
jgi:hypothetical protein